MTFNKIPVSVRIPLTLSPHMYELAVGADLSRPPLIYQPPHTN